MRPARRGTAMTGTQADPATLMHGFPPPPAAQVRWDDGSMWRYPNTRWAFSHMEELLPTTPIRRGPPGPPLPRAENGDIDAIGFTTLDGQAMTWAESLDAVCVDGIVVLHRGCIVYERYPAALRPEGRHIAFSVTKSFVGTLAETLIAEGRLDPAAAMADYVPELAASGFGDATVRQLLDMRTAIAHDEDYVPAATGLTDIARMSIANAMSPRRHDYAGPDSSYGYTASIGKAGAHGGDFVYRTPNTQALQWLIERVTGESLARQIETRWWSKLGMEQDAALTVDRVGTAFGGGGLLASLRDLARFGELVRLGGVWHGEQLIPPAAIAAIRRGGDPAAFVPDYPGLAGGSYGSQWWHRPGGQFMALGVHGQAIHVDVAAELVMARFGSHPVASNRGINPVTVPAVDALTAFLATT